jgi:hypothetical protein
MNDRWFGLGCSLNFGPRIPFPLLLLLPLVSAVSDGLLFRMRLVRFVGEECKPEKREEEDVGMREAERDLRWDAGREGGRVGVGAVDNCEGEAGC